MYLTAKKERGPLYNPPERDALAASVPGDGREPDHSGAAGLKKSKPGR
ncbi:hypothetical protein hamaS1_20860 [Moorella sp. Hama-1]|nr:hypothetical protein hamaS1_20860 [Moorella sp. Hama-1]